MKKQNFTFSSIGTVFTLMILTMLFGGKANAQVWTNVGSAGFSAGVASYSSIAINTSGTPYVAYQDVSNSRKATVMMYNGSSWVTVGSAGFSASEADYTSIAINASGTPYVAYTDYGNSGKATVMMYNGSSWVTVGSAGFSAGEAGFVSLALNASGTPYVAYEDYGNMAKATVEMYNGSSWVTVGGAGFSPNEVNYTSLAINAGGTPYLAYQDYNASGKSTVVKYNGSSWVTVGSAGFSAGAASYTSIAINASGTPYVAYQDAGNSSKATVKTYNGSSWTAVGSALSTGTASYTTIAINASGIPYVAYEDASNSNKATVREFNGTTWSALPPAGFSAGAALYTSIAINSSGMPYVVYEDGANSNKATVMDYPCTPTVSVTSSPSNFTICSGSEASVTASLTVGGAAASGTYAWTPTTGVTTVSATEVNIAPSATTNYTVTGTTSIGCTSTDAFTITVDLPPTGLTPPSPVTQSASPGACGAVVYYSPATLTYVGSPAATIEYTSLPLGAGSSLASGTTFTDGAHTVYLTTDGSNTCASLTNSFEVNVTPNTLSGSTTEADATCNGYDNGSITATVSGGSGNYQFVLTDDNGDYFPPVSVSGTDPVTYTFTGLYATDGVSGDYYITVTDNNCAQTNSYSESYIVLNEPDAIAFTSTISETDPSCHGYSDGSIGTSVTGGNYDYYYTWMPSTPGTGGANPTGVAAGTYSVSVTDGNTCPPAMGSVTVGQPDLLTVSATSTPVSCNTANPGNHNNGTISTTTTGGTGDYSYTYYSTIAGAGYPESGYDPITFPASTYTVTVTDIHFCTATTVVIVDQPDPLSVALTPTNISCNNDNGGTHSDGSISTSVTGGTTSYGYTWFDGISTPNHTGLTAVATYSVIVTDANSCTTSGSATVGEPDAFSATAGNESGCAGSEIALPGSSTGSGGSGAWSVANPYSNSSAGTYTYTFTYTNGSGCTAGATSSIVVLANPTVSVSSVPAICQGGTTAGLGGSFGGGATAATWDDGGAGGTFSWDNYYGFEPDATTYTASPTSSSPVTLTLTTSGGYCGTTSTTTSLVVNPLPVAGTITGGGQNICMGAETVTPYADGTSAYGTGAWSSDNTSIASVDGSGNVYSVSAGSANIIYTVTSSGFTPGCGTASASSPINVIGLPTVSVTPPGPSSTCAGTPVTLTVDYSVSTAPAGSTAMVSADNADPTAGITSCNCPPGYAAVGYTGGTGWWLDQFSLECSKLHNGVVSGAPVLTSSNGVSTGGGPNGPYLLSGNNVLVGGTYWESYDGDGYGFDGQAQDASYVAGMGDNTALPVDAGLISGDSYSVGGFSIGTLFVPNGNVVTGMSGYAYNAYSGNNYYSEGVSLTYTPIAAFSASSIVWSTSATTPSISVTATGSYTATITDYYGCTSTSAPVSVVVNPLPTVNVSPVANICQGGTTAGLGGSFGGGATAATWDDGGAGGTFSSDNLTGLTPNLTTYTAAAGSSSPVTLTLTTSGGYCGNTLSSTSLVVNPTPTVAISASPSAICQGGTTAALGGSFGGGATGATWTDGGAGGSFTGNSGSTPGATTYTASAGAASPVTLTLTTGGGYCGNTSTNTSLVVNATPSITSATAVASSVCPGGTTTIAATGVSGTGASLTWWTGSGGTGTNLGSANPLTAGAGTYYAYVTGTCGTAEASVTVGALTNPGITSVSSASSMVCPSATTNITATGITGAGATLTWYTGINRTGTNLGSANPLSVGPGTYYAYVTGTCPSPAQVPVTVFAMTNAGITSAISSASPICPGTTTTITATGVVGSGKVLTWWTAAGGRGTNLGGANPLTVGPGTYYADVTAICGPTVEVSVAVGSYTSAAITSATSTASSVCPGGTTTITATGVSGTGASLAWWTGTGGTGTSLGSGTSITEGPGTYYAYVTGTCGTAQASATVGTSSLPSVSISSSNNLTCTATSATLTASGATTYTWTGSSATTSTRTVTAAGTYTVTGTGSDGCHASATYTETLTTTPLATPTVTVTNNCGSSTLTAAGIVAGAAVTWTPSGSGNPLTVTTSGSYTATQALSGCTSSASAAVTATPGSGLTLTPTIINVSCHGGSTGSISVAASGGSGSYTYSWSPCVGSTNSITGKAAGTYTVTVTNGECHATGVYTITQPSAALTVSGTVTNVTCNGGDNGKITTTVTGGTPSYTYLWSPGGATASSLSGKAAGTYGVTVTDAHGCTASGSYVITQPVALSCAISVTPSTATYTGGVPTNFYLGYGPQSATCNATCSASGCTYSWSSSSGTSCLSNTHVSNPVYTCSSAGSYAYICTATNGSGCSTTQTVNVCVVDCQDHSHSGNILVCHGSGCTPTTVSCSSGSVPTYITPSYCPSNHLGSVGSGCSETGGREAGEENGNGVITELAVNAYPNPFNGEVNVKIQSNLADNVDITVYDVTGRVMETKPGQPVESVIALGQNLVPGIYFIEVNQGGVVKKVKVVKY